MKYTLHLLFSILLGCVYSDIDVDVNVTANISTMLSSEVIADICSVITVLDLEPDEPIDDYYLGNWESCEHSNECESELCLCATCVDLLELL